MLYSTRFSYNHLCDVCNEFATAKSCNVCHNTHVCNTCESLHNILKYCKICYKLICKKCVYSTTHKCMNLTAYHQTHCTLCHKLSFTYYCIRMRRINRQIWFVRIICKSHCKLFSFTFNNKFNIVLYKNWFKDKDVQCILITYFKNYKGITSVYFIL